ncbi:MAG: coproporphyrinogen dehydrogenase HemZ [Eubacteriales bacterium]|nr:coproporphyrinogen dehydrogenase HemZ [Eubacteriales bacterium]
MKLIFSGHHYKYAVEQMLSTLFPGERPEYVSDGKDSDHMRISLRFGNVYTTSVCRYRKENAAFTGRASVRSDKLTDDLEKDRLCQFIIKNAVYRAVMKSGRAPQPWGSLTGVRPGKLLSAIMRENECCTDRDSKDRSIHQFMEQYDVTPVRAELCYETSKATLETEKLLGSSDICLYVGIPFCPTRCAYCSFVSQSVEKSLKLMDSFFASLRLEVAETARQARQCGLNVVSIYFGGGTPTTLSAAQLDELCSLLRGEFDLSNLREFTVEAGRPDTITEEKLAILKKYGVTRLSVNPQTMQDSVLEAIGRRHTSKDVLDALDAVRKIGGFDVNMDLIAGLPSDTLTGFEYTMEKVLSLEPENITVHTLSLKKGSGLTLSGGKIPEAVEVGKMLDAAYSGLRASGYSPYYLYRQKNMSGGFENTGWMKPGHINIYNICMMEELCSILAMGGGGSTKLIRNDKGKNIRIMAPKYPLEYIEQIDKICSEKVKIGDFYGI